MKSFPTLIVVGVVACFALLALSPDASVKAYDTICSCLNCGCSAVSADVVSVPIAAAPVYSSSCDQSFSESRYSASCDVPLGVAHSSVSYSSTVSTSKPVKPRKLRKMQRKQLRSLPGL